MKHFLLLSALFFVSLTGFAKKQYSENNSFIFYGVNFSKCHTYGYGENYGATVQEFVEINKLFISEMNKYDLEKHLKMHVRDMDLNVSIKQTLAMDTTSMEIFNSSIRLSLDTIQNIIKTLDLKETSGYGMMIFADFLNKRDAFGYFQYILFDIDSREIVESWNSNGEAGGFGIRNYWAKALYNSLRGTQYYNLKYKPNLPKELRRPEHLNDDDLY